jgi:hypothetical protein
MARLRIALIGASTETRILEIHCRPSSGGVVGHMVVYVDGWLAVCVPQIRWQSWEIGYGIQFRI